MSIRPNLQCLILFVAGHKMQKLCAAIGNLKSDNAPNLKGYRPPNECNDYLISRTYCPPENEYGI